MMLEKMPLFEAGEKNYGLYRIPGIVVTKKGTTLAYCEARRKGGDWDTIDILLRRSTDGAKTWGPSQHIAHRGEPVPRSPVALEKKLGAEGDQTVDNPVAIADHKSGAVHFLYCCEYARCFYQRSDDDGATWSRPVEITASDKFRPAL